MILILILTNLNIQTVTLTTTGIAGIADGGKFMTIQIITTPTTRTPWERWDDFDCFFHLFVILWNATATTTCSSNIVIDIMSR